MLEMLHELMAHKGHVDSVVLATVRNSAGASTDANVIDLLHHILLANRFWLLTVLGRPFVLAEESRRSTSLEELVQRYRVTHDAELQWLRCLEHGAGEDAGVERSLSARDERRLRPATRERDP